MLTLDLHAGQIQGFFNIPVDEMTACHPAGALLPREAAGEAGRRLPDLGNTKRARNFADLKSTRTLAIIEKRRTGQPRQQCRVLNLIGSVAGRPAILVDDEIDTAGSITQAAKACIENGAAEVYACCAHAVLSGPAIERLRKLAHFREVVATDSIPIPPAKRIDKLTVISVAHCWARRSSASTPAPRWAACSARARV